MARTKRTRKSSTNRGLTRFFKILIVGVLGIFILFVVIQKSLSFFRNAELFMVKEIVKDPSLAFIESRYLTQLKGQSIFDVDLKATQRRIQAAHPEIFGLRVERRFPDKIAVAAQQRLPFASTTLEGKDMILDKEGVVLGFRSLARGKLPYIRMSDAIGKPMLGKPLRSRQIQVGLEIIEAMQTDTHVKEYHMATMKADNLSKIEIYFSNNMKVIMDKDKISQKVRNLGILLSHGNIDLKGVQYIDLRFKEPILGTRE